ncbi:MAG: ATPase P [Flavobacterium psychrophilum]|jgi:copper chaperone CopZ|nr:heavy-metal-associated domain-containing protein [Bacteroidota bacterium]MCH5688844.1 cation transporter [Niabella sp. W65]MCH7367346.1 cation transporter [Niabella sp. W65]PZR08787.1 MAG: ATPase P [Flavobacterium psychrophilum]ULT43006.1 cation transporter [Niabella sp. I65]
MKTRSIIIAAFLFGAAPVFGYGNSKANAQTSVQTVIKEEPKTVKLKITGMTCAGCSNHVATTLKALDGVMDQKVLYPGDLATVKYDARKTSIDKIIKAIEKIGYKAVTLSDKAMAKQG